MLNMKPEQEACLYILDALEHTVHTHPRDEPGARMAHVAWLFLQPIVGWVLCILALLTFFELPGWCARDPECVASLEDGYLTGNYSSGKSFFVHNRTDTIYPLSGFHILAPHASTAIELLIHFFLGLELFCMIYSLGARARTSPARVSTCAHTCSSACILTCAHVCMCSARPSTAQGCAASCGTRPSATTAAWGSSCTL